MNTGERKTNDNLVQILKSKTKAEDTEKYLPIFNIFQSVDRMDFLPAVSEQEADDHASLISLDDNCNAAYRDAPYRMMSHPAHQSAPNLYKLALFNLDIQPSDSFLQVGSGTGYFQCLVNQQLNPDAISHGIELNETLVQFSRQRTEARRMKMAESSNTFNEVKPIFFHGDGYRIDATRNIKYDKIYIAGGCEDVADLPYFLTLLKPKGILVGPFGSSFLRVTKKKNGEEDDVFSLCDHVMFKKLEKDLKEGKEEEKDDDKEKKGKKNTKKCIVLAPHLFHAKQFQNVDKSFQDAAISVMILSRRGIAGKLPGLLPSFVWFHILRFCTHDWFDHPPKEVDLLKNEICELKKTLNLLQERFAVVSNEIDHYLQMLNYIRMEHGGGEAEEA
jgi:protein-L-isoaspartate O-methyltransferase